MFLKKYKILVVEDDESILFNIRLLLEFNDFDVVSAKNGVETLDLMSNLESIPDLIVSDIMMSEMNGFELLHALKRNFKWLNIPFIFLTARASPEDVNFGKKIGADDYITKPINEELFIASIKEKINNLHSAES